MTFVEDCENPKSVSIILRDGTEHVVDELDWAMKDALRVVSVVVQDKLLAAGGWCA
ncbi:MAG: TCP-1/cpn60 chaperonin family protein [Methanothrix sp.]|nr:TCP-1/cpn60 chaperonin family protein [Methanothrix sp.]